MKKILNKDFFNRSALAVAEDLLGKYLVRKTDGEEIALLINEVEAYEGFLDKASHAHKGKTERTKTMFGHPGYFYVYLVYGMHTMLNIVVGEKNYPAAVLIRGVGDINGPARLTKFLEINRSLNEKKALPKSGLWFEDRGETVNKKEIKRISRVGVDYAGPVWSKKPYRFLIKKRIDST